MTFARIANGAIAETTGRLPASARRVDTGEWVLGFPDADTKVQEACGWFDVDDVAGPVVDATTVADRSVELVEGVPTVVWTERPKTQAELDGEAQQVNGATLRTRADEALAGLRTVAGSSGTLNGLQLSNGLRVCARVLIVLVRLQLSKLDDIT